MMSGIRYVAWSEAFDNILITHRQMISLFVVSVDWTMAMACCAITLYGMIVESFNIYQQFSENVPQEGFVLAADLN